MKKIVRVISLIIVPVVSICAFLAGCKGCGKKVDINSSGIMQDIDVAPAQTAAYEQYSKQALEEYQAVAEKHMVDGETDFDNEEVIKAASSAAAKLYAYACYNERTLDKYVYFSHQDGDTDLGAGGSANATRQEYYLRVNEGENTCGYRFHYTIKKVNDCSGAVALAKGLFESARIRVTDKTNLLYRFEGSKIEYGEDNENLGVSMLKCDWETGKDWGKPDVEMKKSGYIAPENIKRDIEENAGEENITVRGNINVLAENVIKRANISVDDEDCINLAIWIDTDVANGDEASLKMLRKANSSENCEWKKGEDEYDTGFLIICRLWSNGLFRFYNIIERWSGTINGMSGSVESQTSYRYSYSDRDCDMTSNLEMLEDAKKLKGE